MEPTGFSLVPVAYQCNHLGFADMTHLSGLGNGQLDTIWEMASQAFVCVCEGGEAAAERSLFEQMATRAPWTSSAKSALCRGEIRGGLEQHFDHCLWFPLREAPSSFPHTLGHSFPTEQRQGFEQHLSDPFLRLSPLAFLGRFQGRKLCCAWLPSDRPDIQGGLLLGGCFPLGFPVSAFGLPPLPCESLQKGRSFYNWQRSKWLHSNQFWFSHSMSSYPHLPGVATLRFPGRVKSPSQEPLASLRRGKEAWAERGKRFFPEK